jgi:hypothetical protein
VIGKLFKSFKNLTDLTDLSVYYLPPGPRAVQNAKFLDNMKFENKLKKQAT